MKFIRNSKPNTKKRKLDHQELIKIQKRKNMEKKIQEEQFQMILKDKLQGGLLNE